MKTTVDIPDKLYGQARKLAAARGQQVAALITEGLERLVVAHSAHAHANAGQNGHARRTARLPRAAQWLAEWRALGEQLSARRRRTVSAAGTVSRMRR